MNTQEAAGLLQEYLERYRARTYAELTTLVGNQETFQARGESGVSYQIEIQALWDDTSRRTIRVLGAIDDGGLRALVPLCRDFIVAPDGSFIGE
jgi:hypothetical protein